MKWDTACRPTDYPFYAITWCARASSTPKQYLFSLGSWKKIYFGHSFKKVNHPGLLPQQGCVLLYKFEKSWALLGRLSRGFFTISGASNFKHIKRLFMTLSALGLPTNVRDFWLSLLFLYLAFFSCFNLCGSFGLALHFLLSKPSFLHDHLLSNIRIFKVF